MREATDAEIKTYQETSSQLFSTNLTELKVCELNPKSSLNTIIELVKLRVVNV